MTTQTNHPIYKLGLALSGGGAKGIAHVGVIKVLEELGLKDDPLFKIALEIERVALEDDYFVSRKLYPNVDFYTGLKIIGMLHEAVTASTMGPLRNSWLSPWSKSVAMTTNGICSSSMFFARRWRLRK